MGISKYPSRVHLPQQNPGYITVLDFLVVKFPAIKSDIWRNRIAESKVHWADGTLITLETPYQPQQCVNYYREVENEPDIPFQEQIIFQDEQLLLVDKPPFLPVTPGGIYVNECLQNRLRRKTGIEELQALHRLDRETAGLVLFSVNPETRHRYHDLFAKRQIHKNYQAIAKIKTHDKICGHEWNVENRLVKGEPRFLMKVEIGIVNAHSIIRCVAQKEGKALFQLKPITGKTHQLRVHMQTLGWPILHDKFYPSLQIQTPDDFSKPLQLLAKELSFIDPVSKESRSFCSDRNLNW